MQGMDHTAIESLLQAVARGDIPPDQALRHLGDATAADSLQGLHLDHERALRTGLGEVVFAQGKTDGALVGAVRGLSLRGAPVLVSRASEAQGTLLQREFPAGRYWAQCRLFCLGGEGREVPELGPPWPERGEIMVVTAGAADIPVGAEAYGALRFWGHDCGFLTDVGVAGLHRLAPHIRDLRAARLIIAVAGMEGALPGVLAGLVPCPVLAVPTSVGYGVGAGGMAALHSMLCSCVPGLAVLNIDNGFGAAAFAAKLLRHA